MTHSWHMCDSMLKLKDFILQMMGFVLKMMDFVEGHAWAR